jgi:hypothetical protein
VKRRAFGRRLVVPGVEEQPPPVPRQIRPAVGSQERSSGRCRRGSEAAGLRRGPLLPSLRRPSGRPGRRAGGSRPRTRPDERAAVPGSPGRRRPAVAAAGSRAAPSEAPAPQPALPCEDLLAPGRSRRLRRRPREPEPPAEGPRGGPPSLPSDRGKAAVLRPRGGGAAARLDRRRRRRQGLRRLEAGVAGLPALAWALERQAIQHVGRRTGPLPAEVPGAVAPRRAAAPSLAFRGASGGAGARGSRRRQPAAPSSLPGCVSAAASFHGAVSKAGVSAAPRLGLSAALRSDGGDRTGCSLFRVGHVATERGDGDCSGGGGAGVCRFA